MSRPLKPERNWSLFATALAACLLCIDTTSGLSVHRVTSSIVTAFILSGLCSLTPGGIRAFIQLVVGEGVIAVCLIDCYCQEYFFSPITPQLMTSILLSDAREACEFLSAFVGIEVLLRWRIASLLMLAACLPVSLFVSWQLPTTLRNRRLVYACLALLLLCAACEAPAFCKFSQLFMQKQETERLEGLIFRRYHQEVPTPLHRLVFACYSSVQSREVLRGIKHSTLVAGIDSCSHASPHIVLAIGESYNKHHSSLYGYRLPTTPLQQKRLAAGELTVFTDVVTPWNITSNVFLDMFSLWEHGSRRHVSEYPLFPILFRRAGYQVTFFSNQYQLRGFRKGTTNQAGHFFLADRELSDSLFSLRNRKSAKYDMGLISQLAQFRKGEELPAYSLDIVHLIGQHFKYSARYPHRLSYFSAADYQGRNLEEDARKIVMHYDNATRYDDAVLDSLLTLYEDEEAIVIFIADHGEEVYDELPTHGRLHQEPTGEQARNEFEVPMWIWCSKKYGDRHPDIVAAIRTSASRPFLSDDIPQILLYLAGIESAWTDDTRNLLSPRYRSKQRVIAGDSDYDSLVGRRKSATGLQIGKKREY